MFRIKTIVSAVLLTTGVSLSLVGCQSTSSIGATSAVTVIKPEIDDRSYAFQTLENGLKVVVISDPDADKAAAALDVHVGHLADPKDREGLSHYLEHMLFLGTKKYPKVEEYSEFIEKHGGSQNASTGMEHTTYFFEINNEQFEPALDRFSRFFIDPLFDKEFVQKEREAVHSEYKLKIKDNWRRFNEAVKQTANPEHPMTQFSVGNLDTLSDNKNSSIYDDVIEHYKSYYSAGIMTLVVVGNYSTQELMSWAENKFSDVPNNGFEKSYDRPEPYLPSQRGVEVFVQTLENKRNLTIRFALPDSMPFFKEKPINYLSHLVGHEVEGSLYGVLKKKGYVKSLSIPTWGPHDFTRLGVDIELTNKGYENREEVIELFFSYIKLIREQGIQESIFSEKAQIAHNQFEFQEKYTASYLAANIASGLQHYPAEHALDHWRVYEQFNPKMIQEFLSYITPENARIIVTSPDVKGDKNEPLYDVSYSMSKIQEERVEKWRNVSIYSEFSLPKANPYIAENLSLEKDNSVVKPELTYESKGIKLWMTNENEFGLPKAALSFNIYSPELQQSKLSQVVQELHAEIISDIANTDAYNASLAGLYYNIWSSPLGYGLSVSGFDEKVDLLLSSLLENFNASTIPKDVFERIKLNKLQEYQNFKFSYPIQQVYTATLTELYSDGLTPQAKFELLSDLEFEQFQSEIRTLLSKIEIDGVYSGNVSKAEVESVGDLLKKKFDGSLTENAKPKLETVKLKQSIQPIRNVKIDHDDSSILYVISGETESIKEDVKFRMLAQVLRQRFYKSLRTDQQYGYIVGLTRRAIDKTPSIMMHIQSPKAHPAELKVKMEEFLLEQESFLSTVSQQEFDQHREGLLSDIDKKFKNVGEKVFYYHSELLEDNYAFDTRDNLIKEINALSRADILEFFKTTILSEQKRSMIGWNIGNAHREQADIANYQFCSTSKCVTKKLQ
ncbi:MAG: insulinase family protein [Gammaproteobacteria bacterium]|nr:insulinase family protein [Gammaproteobacteria bacterium]